MNEPITWICIGFAMTAAISSHYLLKHYHVWTSGWRLIGRYVVGVLCFMVPFYGWHLEHLDATASQTVGTLVVLTVATGLATIAVYGIDNTHDREVLKGDERQLGVDDGTP